MLELLEENDKNASRKIRKEVLQKRTAKELLGHLRTSVLLLTPNGGNSNPPYVVGVLQ